MLRFAASLCVSLVLLAVTASSASAQFLGTFRWRLAPFCNVVTLDVTQVGSTLALDGFDDQCGTAARASAVGTAALNANGRVTVGLSIVTTPDAVPIHVTVSVRLTTIGGPWVDSGGNGGTFEFEPPSPTPGSPRPGPIGHSHTLPGLNTAVGNSTLDHTTTGNNNTAVGSLVLTANAAGSGNTAMGTFAMNASVGGHSNTAIGVATLDALTAGSRNTAIGANALPILTTGDGNVAVGNTAGATLTSGSDNVYIGSAAAAAAENGTIRIGNSGNHAATFIAGIIAQSVDDMSDRPVLIDASGKLGTIASSARFKQDVRPLEDMSAVISRLEPVSFRYIPDQHRGASLQYGLIAEQVADVLPQLVIRDEDGRPQTVKYHVLPTLLLAEIQRLERERAALATELRELRERVLTIERERR